MNRKTWKSYLFYILLCEAVGLLSGWISREGIREFSQTAVQPLFSPPAILFPFVWTTLYALMGIGAARVKLAGGGLGLFYAQLVVNFFWSPVFFNLAAYGFAFFWLLLLLGLVLGMTKEFHKFDRTAALLQIPYLIWLCIAAYLNGGVWVLN